MYKKKVNLPKITNDGVVEYWSNLEDENTRIL
jgi:hypothetical protein